MTTHDPDAVPTMTLAEPRAQQRTEPTPEPAGENRWQEQDSHHAEPEAGHEAERQPEAGHQAEPDAAASPFADDELAGLRARWNTVQAGFVDDPRDCVQRADGLVSDVLGQLTQGFTDARSRLEEQWSRGEEASTEDLRVALTRYRDFFERLLSV
jgi:hypothetical protein